MRGLKRWTIGLAICALGASVPLFVWAGQHGGHGEDPHAAPAAHAASEHGQTGGEHGEHGAHHGPKPINWFDFGNHEQPPFAASILNFLLLASMYYYFGRKPVAEGLKNRRAEVAKEIEEAQRMKREAEERAKQYQAKLEHLEEELAVARRALLEAGEGEKARLVKEAEEKAVRMRKDAEFLVAQELKQIRQDLLRETVAMAVTAAEEILKSKVTAADQERLAEEYLAALGQPQPSPGGAS